MLSAALIGLSACSEPIVARPRATPQNFAAALAAGCGASFTLITDEQDTLMAAYGIPPTHDTISVCETWTGTDYNVSTKLLGSSEFYVSVRDTMLQTTYDSGNVSGFDANGVQVGEVAAVGPTAFDFIGADSATRKASYDDPYYAVYSPSPGSCANACKIAPSASAGVLSPSVSTSALDDTTSTFRRHGVTRRGVRALLDPMDEIGRAANGVRRFHKIQGDADITLSIDPEIGLLVGEDIRTRDGTVVVSKHSWKQTPDGWVHDRTEIVSAETIDGHRYHDKTTLTYLDVSIKGINQSRAAKGQH